MKNSRLFIEAKSLIRQDFHTFITATFRYILWCGQKAAAMIGYQLAESKTVKWSFAVSLEMRSIRNAKVVGSTPALGNPL
jgi:hypothetical protein